MILSHSFRLVQGYYWATFWKLPINLVLIIIRQVQKLVSKGCLRWVVKLPRRALLLLTTLDLLHLTLKPSIFLLLQLLDLLLELSWKEISHLTTLNPQDLDVCLSNN